MGIKNGYAIIKMGHNILGRYFEAADDTMALYDADDELFTPKGQEDADTQLRAIYTKMGVPDLYRGYFFPGPHKFDVAMQKTAFAFFDEWLKK